VEISNISNKHGMQERDFGTAILRTKLIPDTETWPKNVVISYRCNVPLSIGMMSSLCFKKW